jgi:plastocyanin
MKTYVRGVAVRKGKRSMVAALAVGASVASFGLIQSAGSPADAAAPAAPKVTMLDSQPGSGQKGYDPPEVAVKVGQAVTWKNGGQEAHTVTADDGSFDSGSKNAGEEWANTFSKPGTFTYKCTPHPWMTGTVKVS